MSNKPLCVFWHRRDLRIEDNVGLHAALACGQPVVGLFIFDTDILEGLANKADARVEYILHHVCALAKAYAAEGGCLLVKIGRPVEVWEALLAAYHIVEVHTNADYEPYAIARDAKVGALLAEKGVVFHHHKDQVIFEKDEVLSVSGKFYGVFTPYKKAWLAKAGIGEDLESKKTVLHGEQLAQLPCPASPTLAEIGFLPSGIPFPSDEIDEVLIRSYDKTRNFPAQNTSRLGLALRFGTISIRQLVRNAMQWNEVFLSELIWREFFMQLLFHRPETVSQNADKRFDNVDWRNNEIEYEAWKAGKTGYPMVDAGMRQLGQTGWMHNRVRMIVASFLCKHLLIDWRLGEAWFAEKLLDYDQAQNIGNWQWVAGSGADAAPYFRIFNPAEQQKKFDPFGEYTARWIDELGTSAYPKPIVEHVFARNRALEVFKAALAQK